jgi:hypothetical protein
VICKSICLQKMDVFGIFIYCIIILTQKIRTKFMYKFSKKIIFGLLVSHTISVAMFCAERKRPLEDGEDLVVKRTRPMPLYLFRSKSVSLMNVEVYGTAQRLLNSCFENNLDSVKDFIRMLPYPIGRVSGAKRRDVPLTAAILTGNVEIVKELLEWGVCPHEIDCLGETPLYVAAKVAKYNEELGLEIASMLIEYFTEIDTVNGPHRETPLMAAANSDSLRMVQLLLANCADKTKTDYHGQSALCYVVKQRLNSRDIRELLAGEST